jgi:hypothetical protein
MARKMEMGREKERGGGMEIKRYRNEQCGPNLQRES